MGQKQSQPYQDKGDILQRMMVLQHQSEEEKEKNVQKEIKLKRDGNPIRSKRQMAVEYDESSVPFPVKNFVKLDYCWKITSLMFVHSLYFSVPTTLTYMILKDRNQFWKYKFRTFPYFRAIKTYLTIVLVFNSLNSIYNLTFEDYW